MIIRKRYPIDLQVIAPENITADFCAEFFTWHKDDFIYVVEDNKFLGVIDHNFNYHSNTADYIHRDIITLSLEEASNTVYVSQLFQKSLKLKRVPVLSNTGELLYEYMNVMYDDYALEVKKNSLLIKYLNMFAKFINKHDIIDNDNDTVVILANEQDAPVLKTAFCSILSNPVKVVTKLSQLKNSCSYKVVINVKYHSRTFQLLKQDYIIEKVIDLQDILIQTVLSLTHDYLNRSGVKLLCLEIPFGDKWGNIPLPTALNDSSIIDDFTSEHPEERSYLISTEYGVANVCKTSDNGIHRILSDVKTPFFNTQRGERITVGSPETFVKAIHVYGECTACGLCTSDAYTIESILQKKLNELKTSYYRVFNHGVVGVLDIINNFIYLLNTPFRKGDIAILLGIFTDEEYRMFDKFNIDYLNTKSQFMKLKGRWFLNNPAHCNPSANELFADIIMDYFNSELTETYQKAECLTQNPRCFWQESSIDVKNAASSQIMPVGFAHYIEYIARRKQYSRKKNGIVAFNSDPFTLGHEYLLGYAASMVDTLFVMTLENDSSYFSSIDRFNMIELGASKFKNVHMITTSSIMGNNQTMPEYFFPETKKKDDKTQVKFPVDFEIFATLVAPVLNIDVYYLGEEPTNQVSNKLLQIACEYMPKHGVEVCIIPRKKLENSNEFISASTVRKLYERSDWAQLKSYVPDTTLRYLQTLKYNQEQSY